MAKEYTVMRIDELTRLSNAGELERFYRHRIETTGGVVLSVDIDQENFTPEKTEPILKAAAKNADTILKL